MAETDEQIERYGEMCHSERSWRTYWGLLSLTGYAKWKAGFIVLRTMVLTIAIVAVAAYLLAALVAIPLSLIFDFDPSVSISIETDSGLAFYAIVAGLFFWIAPGFALNAYGGIRDDLEKLTREEGTFWEARYASERVAVD